MSGLKHKIAAILIAGSTFANAQYKPAIHSMAGINLKVSDDAMLKIKGGVGLGNQLEQVDEYYYKYSKKGMTSREASLGILVEIGKFGNLSISGGGEILAQTRKIDDSLAKSDLFEWRPSGLLNLTFPFAEIFKAQHLLRFERRIFRQPGDVVSHLRYNSETRISTDEVLPLNTGVFLYYKGFVQNGSRSMSHWGGGITMAPMENLFIELGYSMHWMPEKNLSSPGAAKSSISPVYLGVTYTFDFTK